MTKGGALERLDQRFCKIQVFFPVPQKNMESFLAQTFKKPADVLMIQWPPKKKSCTQNDRKLKRECGTLYLNELD